MNSILAVAHISRGFGFVVLDSALRATDWGVKDLRGQTNAIVLTKAVEIVDAHGPDVLVIEDWSDLSLRAQRRTKEVFQRVARAARLRGIQVERVRRTQMRAFFAATGAVTNQEILHAVGEMIPDLHPLIPRPRKPWQSQPYATSIFRAGAFAISFAVNGNKEPRLGHRGSTL